MENDLKDEAVPGVVYNNKNCPKQDADIMGFFQKKITKEQFYKREEARGYRNQDDPKI